METVTIDGDTTEYGINAIPDTDTLELIGLTYPTDIASVSDPFSAGQTLNVSGVGDLVIDTDGVTSYKAGVAPVTWVPATIDLVITPKLDSTLAEIVVGDIVDVLYQVSAVDGNKITVRATLEDNEVTTSTFTAGNNITVGDKLYQIVLTGVNDYTYNIPAGVLTGVAFPAGYTPQSDGYTTVEVSTGVVEVAFGGAKDEYTITRG